jgi:integrase
MITSRIFKDLKWISERYGFYLTAEEVAEFTREGVERIEKETTLGSLVCLENKYNAFDVVYWNFGIDSKLGDALTLAMYKHTGINNLRVKKSKEPHYGKITRRNNGLLMCSLSCPGKKRENLYARDENELIAKAEAWVLEEKQKILFERLKTEAGGKIEELSRLIDNEIKAERPVVEARENTPYVIDFENVVVQEETVILTFEMAFVEWIKRKREGGVKPQTIDRFEAAYKRHIAKNKNFISKSVNEITDNDVCKVLSNIKKTFITKKEYNTPYKIIKDTLKSSIFLDGYEVHITVDFENVKYLLDEFCKFQFRTEKKEEIAIDVETEEKLINEIDKQAKESCVRKAQYYLIKLNFYLGLRIGELVALTVDDIDLDEGKIHINKAEIHYREVDKVGKYTGKRIYEISAPKSLSGIREVLLIDESRKVVEELLSYRERRGYRRKELFYDGDVRDLENRAGKLHNKYKKVAKRLGMTTKEFHCHLQRKTLATSLFEISADERLMIETMGHIDIDTTKKFYNIKTKNDDIRKREMLRHARDARQETYA